MVLAKRAGSPRRTLQVEQGFESSRCAKQVLACAYEHLVVEVRQPLSAERAQGRRRAPAMARRHLVGA
jgi:hypothetical protein